MKVTSTRLILLSVLLLLRPACLTAQDLKVEQSPNVLERFPVNRNGDVLLLPVTFNGKVHQFVLDTGANFTLYDNSLPLGAVKDTILTLTPGGLIDVPFFDAPAAKVGKLRLQTAPRVAGYDHTKMREVCGYEIFGILGMDFLKQHVIQIDCDRGEVLFLKAASADAGVPFRLVFEDGFPFIDGTVDGLDKARFLLDSGFVTRDAGLIEAGVVSGLVRSGALRTVGQGLVETLAGSKTHKTFQGKYLNVGDFSIANPAFSEGYRNMLGLGFLSRFKVTFDFPNKVMYLQKGQYFDRPDVWDVSGLHLLRKKNETIVHSVDKDSAAALRGVKAGDKIAKFGARKAESMSLFEIRWLCSQRGATLDLAIQREEKLYSAKVSMKQ